MKIPRTPLSAIPPGARWLFMLCLPLIIIVFGDNLTLGQRLGGTASLLLFVVFYVLLTGRPPYLEDLESGRWSGWRSLLNTAGWLLAGLAASTLAMIATVQWTAAYLIAFLGAAILFSTPRRLGIPIVGSAIAFLTGASVLLMATTSISPGLLWQVIGNCLGAASVIFVRIEAGENIHKAAIQQQLAEATQREAIARDVHDILGHTLTVLTLKAEVAKRLIATNPDAAERELDDILDLSRSAQADVRSTVQGLHPPDFETQLTLSVQRLELAGVAVSISGQLSHTTDGSAPDFLRWQTMSWALREATTNILRHANASSVTINYSPTHLRVTDDGSGWDTSQAAAGSGIAGLRTRAHTAGAELTVSLVAPHGTCVELRWPESRTHS